MGSLEENPLDVKLLDNRLYIWKVQYSRYHCMIFGIAVIPFVCDALLLNHFPSTWAQLMVHISTWLICQTNWIWLRGEFRALLVPSDCTLTSILSNISIRFCSISKRWKCRECVNVATRWNACSNIVATMSMYGCRGTLWWLPRYPLFKVANAPTYGYVYTLPGVFSLAIELDPSIIMHQIIKR